MPASTLRLAYKPKPLAMALGALFFAGCAVVLFRVAQTNDRALILNGIIELGVGGATTFYWVLTACCAAFVAVAVVAVTRAFGSTSEVVLDDRALSAPRGALRSTIVRVPLDTITGLQVREVNRQRLLTVLHRKGKLSIAGSMLPERGDLDLLATEIGYRCSARAGDTPPASSQGLFGRHGC